MRATRAFVGAFGAGISLAIAGSLALLLVSSVIAFRGWPDDLAGTSVPDAAELSKAQPGSLAGETVAVALPEALTSTSSSKGKRAAGRSGGSGATAGQATGSGSTAVPSDAVGEQGGSSAIAPADGAPASPLVNPKNDPVTTVTNSVTGATQTVTESAAPVVSGALESVGAGGPEAKAPTIVEQVTQAVGKTGDLVLP